MSRTLLPLVCGALIGGGAVYLSNRLPTDAEVEPLQSDHSEESSRPSSLNARDEPEEDSERLSNDTTEDDASVGSGFESIMARAMVEPEEVLAELSDLSPPATQREVALAVLAALGNDDAMVSRVATMLPEADRLSFRIDALADRARSDLGSAMRSALALSTSAARRLAIPEIAAIAGSLDPAVALAQASLIANRELRTLYLASAATGWAATDGPAALSWLESAVPAELSAEAASESLKIIAAYNQELLLDRLDDLSPALQPVARREAFVAMAYRDPGSALAAIESMGAGRDVSELEGAVAEVYALQDPAAAVAWAKTRPDSLSALAGALRGAAIADYEVAVDLAMQILETEPISATFALVESAEGEFGLLADRLLASNVDGKDQKFQQLMVRWPQVDATAALEWSLANADKLQKSWLSLLTLNGGRDDPERAIALLDRVPSELRQDWIAGVAAGIAANDPQGALAFLEQHQGEPGYERGLAGIVDSMAESDPVAAARLVDRTGADAAGRVGWGWAQKDPLAASEWVAALQDPDQRRDGITNLAGYWSRTDPDAAISWLLELPDDQARDFGLQTSIATAVARDGSIDESAINAIGDDRIRNLAAMNALVVLGRSKPEEARRLVDEYIDDANVRQQTLRQIAEQQGGMDAVTIFSSGVDIPR